MNTQNSIPAGFLPAMVELPEDTNPEYVRDDVVVAVGGAFMGLQSPIVTVRASCELGRLDERCTSAPVLVGAL